MEKLKEIFEEEDEKPFDPSKINVDIHPNARYTSSLVNYINLPHPVNSNKVKILEYGNCIFIYLLLFLLFNINSILNLFIDSKQIELDISDYLSNLSTN